MSNEAQPPGVARCLLACASDTSIACNRADRVEVRLVCTLDLCREFSQRSERLVLWVLGAHPGRPGIVHVLEHNTITLRQRKDRVQAKQPRRIAIGKETRRDHATNRLRKLINVAQLAACRISSAT